MNHSHVWTFRNILRRTLVLAAVVALATTATAQDTVLQLDAAHTSVKFILGDVLHTVRGTFQLKQGTLQFDPLSGKISGLIVVDAKSGDSGSGMRDRKMHREILESERYPEIIFRPDRVQGTVAQEGKSTVQVRGIFSIHGTDHEITVPADVEMGPDHWTAAVHFTIPYVKWGMKNPSTLFLRVNDSVQIDLVASGSVRPTVSRASPTGLWGLRYTILVLIETKSIGKGIWRGAFQSSAGKLVRALDEANAAIIKLDFEPLISYGGGTTSIRATKGFGGTGVRSAEAAAGNAAIPHPRTNASGGGVYAGGDGLQSDAVV
jgi:polyisoprenoid-binding protein YceI